MNGVLRYGQDKLCKENQIVAVLIGSKILTATT